jgi:hypothetical protein
MSKVTLNWNRIMQSARLYPRKTIENGFWQVIRNDAVLQQLIADSGDKNDIMKILFDAFRQSIDQTNADKEYYLNRLAQMNEISEALLNAMKDLLSKTDDSIDGPYKCQSKAVPGSWLPVRSTIKPALTIKPARKKIP